MTEHKEKPEHEKEYFFFVNGNKYYSENATLTGLQIKGFVPDYDPTFALYEESQGNDPDTVISDETTVTLEKDKGPKRFYTVPPATFGNA